MTYLALSNGNFGVIRNPVAMKENPIVRVPLLLYLSYIGLRDHYNGIITLKRLAHMYKHCTI